MKFYTLLLAVLAAIAGSATYAQNDHGQHTPAPTFDNTKALHISQAAIGNTISNFSFTSSTGEKKRFSDYAGKPLIISLIYTSCYHICPTTTQHLNKVVQNAKQVLGEDSFNVVTIGFDSANDNANAMRVFAKQQSVNEDNWDFLATDQTTINQFAKELGFQFFPSASGFDHLIQTTLLDENSVVKRQVYGIKFETPHLVEPLKQLVFGEKEDHSLLQEINSKVRLFCTVYDPYSDSYQFDYSIFVGLLVGLTLGGCMLIIFVREWRYSKARTKSK
jgi:protein SCO1/2